MNGLPYLAMSLTKWVQHVIVLRISTKSYMPGSWTELVPAYQKDTNQPPESYKPDQVSQPIYQLPSES